MFNNLFKILPALIFAALIFALPGQGAAYNVSGLVSFSYSNAESRTGDTVTSYQYWTQDYQANMNGILWDPRFMMFNAGVGYSVSSGSHSHQDYDTITYNIATNFLPGMKVSGNLFGTKSINTVESSGNIAGREITTTSYGGTLNLNLNRGRNNNSNNNYGRSAVTLPNITLSRIHTESEAVSITNPLHETRDDTRAIIQYRPSATFDLNIDGGLEQYENQIAVTAYETKTLNLASNIGLSPYADLKLKGNMTDRETDNITGYDATTKSWNYGIALDFKEINRFRHNYTYDYFQTDTSATELTTQRAGARAIYKLIQNIEVNGGLEYSLSEYVRDPSPTPGDTGEKVTLESGGLHAGISYWKKYAPHFLGPFVFDTRYDYNYGYSKITTDTGGVEGTGSYYANNVGLGIISEGWKQENLSLTYNYNNKRDDSPLNNDSWQHTYRFAVNTRRIPKTTINASANYISQQITQSVYTEIFLPPQGTNQGRRALTYALDVNHTVNAYLNLSAGATRGQTTVSFYSLSTLTPASIDTTRDEIRFGALNFSYAITRNLVYRAILREEYRSTKDTDTQAHYLTMNLDYRIRQIFVNLEYRWRQDIPEGSLRTEQQYYFVKLTRPF